jgi:hypothetical protein
VLEKNRNWKISNPDKVKKHNSDCYARDRENRIKRMYAWAEKNPEKKKAAYKKYAQKHKDKGRARLAKRRAQKKNATPPWLTRQHMAEIRKVYSLAFELERKTGVKHHVDHIVPLRGKNVSGLHVPWNLRAIPAEENLRKWNRFDE